MTTDIRIELALSQLKGKIVTAAIKRCQHCGQLAPAEGDVILIVAESKSIVTGLCDRILEAWPVAEVYECHCPICANEEAQGRAEDWSAEIIG